MFRQSASFQESCSLLAGSPGRYPPGIRFSANGRPSSSQDLPTDTLPGSGSPPRARAGRMRP